MNSPGFAVDPIIQALIAKLPEVGSVWSKAGRQVWLDLLRQSFELIYQDNSDRVAPFGPDQSGGRADEEPKA